MRSIGNVLGGCLSRSVGDDRPLDPVRIRTFVVRRSGRTNSVKSRLTIGILMLPLFGLPDADLSIVLPIFLGLLTILFVKKYRYYCEKCRLMENSVRRDFVVVTGCDSGFGRALTIRLLTNGFNVVAGCFTTEGLESLEDESLPLSGQLYACRLDITDQKSVDECFAFVEKILRQNFCNLWALVNNAGYCSLYGPSDWVPVDAYKQSLDVNLLGTIRMTQKFVPMLKRSRGRIVTMISASGRIHGFYTAPYVTAKFGLEGFMDSIRLELRPFGVSACILEPGAFRTQLLDKDAMLKRVEGVWNRLPESVKEEYGEEFRDNFVRQWMSGVDLVANPDVSAVVNAYYDAITSPNPKHRYQCGWDARLVFIPLSFLPSWMQDPILEFLPKLQFMPPLVPAATKRLPNLQKQIPTESRGPA